MAGLEFMMKTPAISLIMPFSIALNFLFAPFSVLLPSWVKDVLNKGPEVFGFIQTAQMGGMVLGSLAVGLIAHKVRMSWALPASLVVMALSIIGFATTRQVWVALLFMGIMGITNAFTNVVFNSFLQAVVPREMMGRVWGALGTIGQVAAPAGQALAGFLGQVVALPVLFGAQGWATTVISAGYCLAPRIREVFESVEKSIAQKSEAD
jgi:MFS family permease